MTDLMARENALLLHSDGDALAINDPCCCDCCAQMRRCVTCEDSDNGWVGGQLTIAGSISQDANNNCGASGATCDDILGTYDLCGFFEQLGLPLPFAKCGWNGLTAYPVTSVSCIGGSSGLGIGFQAGISCDVLGNMSIGAIMYGDVYALWSIDDPTEAAEAFATLCAGGTVDLAFVYSSSVFPCNMAGTVARLQLVCPQGDCDAVLPDGTCDGLLLCGSFPNLDASITEFQNFDTPPPDTTSGIGIGTAHWLLSNLNRGYSLPYVSGTYEFELDLVDSVGDYSDPGILIMQGEFEDPGYRWEFYVHKIKVKVACLDGETRIELVDFYWQEFAGTPGGLTFPFLVSYGNEFVANSVFLDSAGSPGKCFSTFMQTTFSFQDFVVGTGDGSQRFLISGVVGPQT